MSYQESFCACQEVLKKGRSHHIADFRPESKQEHNTAFGELVVFDFPWRWLEKFDKAGGNFALLSIRPKFPS